MRSIRSVAGVRRVISQWGRQRHSVGFVPTMGALHEGHRSLIRKSRRLCDRTVVSIFVNPTQFGPGEDFEAYPRPFRKDLDVCREEGVDLVFAPAPVTMYAEGFCTTVKVGPLGQIWEGRVRPGHFDGVATVVLKLLSIVKPDMAVFGQKDYQQVAVIRRLVADFALSVRIVVAPTVRERDGLALSSRNEYLDTLSRQAAPGLYRALSWARDQVSRGRCSVTRLEQRMRQMVEDGGMFKLDYAAFCDKETLRPKPSPIPPLVILIAATCMRKGPAYNRRFIDNIVLP